MDPMKRKAEENLGDGVDWVRGCQIGRGAFGSVFVARVRPSSKKLTHGSEFIAIKSAKLWNSQSIVREGEVFEDLMYHGGCPYIIHCYGDELTISDAGDEVFNLALEIAHGGSLSDQIGDHGNMPESLVSIYTWNILQGVKHIHDCGYVHCDIKPQNILLAEYPNKDGLTLTRVAKVADLGLAKKKNSRCNGWQGTWNYLSPEALREEEQEQPSDIWALGCVVLQMLTRVSSRDPFYNWLRENAIRELKTRMSDDAYDFLMCCFQVDPEDRWTAEELLSHPFVAACAKLDICTL